MNGLIFIFIIIIFSVLLSFANRLTFIRGKKTYWIFGSYTIILVASTIFYLFVLDNDNKQATQLTTDHIPNLETIAFNNESLEKIAPFLVKEEHIHYEHDRLTIQTYEPDYTYVPVLIERKEENDQTIDFSVYQIPTIIESVDVTDDIKPANISIVNESLTLHFDDIFINLNITKHEFPIRQFTGEKIFYDDNPPLSRPNQLIYMKIPEEIDLLINEDVNVFYRN